MTKFTMPEADTNDPIIRVIGVGGGGSNAVSHMVGHIEGVEFVCANTDAQVLKTSNVATVLQLGKNKTKGLGAGANPTIGKEAAQEDKDRIAEILDGANMAFITAGMGGGTGTGAAPIFAEISKAEKEILTIGVVTMPFPFEGRKRMKIAVEGVKELRECVDSLIVIENEQLMPVVGANASLITAFETANRVLFDAVRGIAELITRPGLVNVDFADVKTVMLNRGLAMMGMGTASGEKRAEQATEDAIKSPLLGNIDLHGAQGILVNITAGHDLTLGEFDQVGRMVHEYANDNTEVIIGTALNTDMQDEVQVTIVVTGIQEVAQAGQVDPSDKKATRRESVNFDSYDAPAAMRKRSEPMLAANNNEFSGEIDSVPAYLRKQADT